MFFFFGSHYNPEGVLANIIPSFHLRRYISVSFWGYFLTMLLSESLNRFSWSMSRRFKSLYVLWRFGKFLFLCFEIYFWFHYILFGKALWILFYYLSPVSYCCRKWLWIPDIQNGWHLLYQIHPLESSIFSYLYLLFTYTVFSSLFSYRNVLLFLQHKELLFYINGCIPHYVHIIGNR